MGGERIPTNMGSQNGVDNHGHMLLEGENQETGGQSRSLTFEEANPCHQEPKNRVRRLFFT